MAALTATEINVLVNAKVDKALQSLKVIEKQTKKTSGTFKQMSKAMNFIGIAQGAQLAQQAIGFVVDVVTDLAKGAMQAEQSEVKLAAVLRATGNASGMTAREMTSYADKLEMLTGVDGDLIASAEAVLATFKSVKGDTFKQATEAALDMSKVFGQDMTSSATQLGKALEDPIAGISALKRVGVSFTEAQKNTIKSMVDAGDKAGAQALILKELNSQVGGVARALGDTAQGRIDRFGQTLKRLGEEALRPATDAMGKFFNTMNIGMTTQHVMDKFIRQYAEFGKMADEFNKKKILSMSKEEMATNLQMWEAYAQEAEAAISMLDPFDKEQQKIKKSLEGSAAAYRLMIKWATDNTWQGKIAAGQKKADENAATSAAKKQEDSEKQAELDAKNQAAYLEYVEKRKQEEQRAIDQANQNYAEWLQSEDDKRDKILENLEEIRKKEESIWQERIDIAMQFGNMISENLAASIKGAEDAWKGWANMGIEAIAMVLEGFAKQWAIEAAAAAATGNFAGAAGLTAAAVGASVGAGAVRALKFAKGGEFITNGPMMMIAGERGRERVRVEPVDRPGSMALRSGNVFYIQGSMITEKELYKKTARQTMALEGAY